MSCNAGRFRYIKSTRDYFIQVGLSGGKVVLSRNRIEGCFFFSLVRY
jgi:hypothetical protein